MEYTEVLNALTNRSTETVSTDLAENHRALTHARDQYHYWSMEARWRGGGSEYRIRCQDQEKFFASWIERLEHCQNMLLSRVAMQAAPVGAARH